MRSRIGAQLILAVALISVAVFALLSFILITAQRRSLISQMKRHSTEIIETIRSSTRYAMMHNQREELTEIINAIGSQPAISKVRILNKDGEIVYSPDSRERGHRVNMEAEACFGCHGTKIPRERLEVVRAPIGLDIGGETPAEIAVSIVAEIVHLRGGGTGQPLSQKESVLSRFHPQGDQRGES